jgi:hypothetical protein
MSEPTPHGSKSPQAGRGGSPQEGRGGSPDPPRSHAQARAGSGDPPRDIAAVKARRRRLLDAAVRWPLLGAIGLLAGRLAAASAGGPLHPDKTCTNQGLCRGCRQLAGCRSLQADLFRSGAPPDGRAPERRLS